MIDDIIDDLFYCFIAINIGFLIMCWFFLGIHLIRLLIGGIL